MQNIADAMFIFIGLLLFMFLAVVMAMNLDTVLKRFPRAKKALDKVMDIQVCELSQTERVAIARYINNEVIDFIGNWSNGDSNKLRIPLFKIKLDEYDQGVYEELELIQDLFLDYIDDWDIDFEQQDLYIEVSSYMLELRFERQMSNWRSEGQLEREEYHRSRGVS